MSYDYAQKKRTPGQTAAPTPGGGAMESAVPNSARLAALESGQISPTAADKGHRVDLPEAMRSKMESSFGMDFSAVKLYESETLGQTGAEAMAQGNEIAFAPGKLDFASQSGQALLGHELSHVASQARGQVHGNGFLLDGGLEARADREGAMAARGESIFTSGYGGAVAPLSTASAAPMAGPMQASKGGDKKKGGPVPRNVEYIYNGNERKKGQYGVGPQIGTALKNTWQYTKNLGSNFADLFRKNKKAELHKDLMSEKRRNAIALRADWDTAQMFNENDDDDDDLEDFDAKQSLEFPFDEEDVYD